MKKIDKVIIFLGICDITYFIYYFVNSIINKDIPLFTDILRSLKVSNQIGNFMPFSLALLGVFCLFSLIFSGYFLILRKRNGAKIVYFQLPLRIILVMPSFFFIIWPMKIIFHNVIIIVAMIITELIKLFFVINWHINLKKSNVEKNEVDRQDRAEGGSILNI